MRHKSCIKDEVLRVCCYVRRNLFVYQLRTQNYPLCIICTSFSSILFARNCSHPFRSPLSCECSCDFSHSKLVLMTFSSRQSVFDNPYILLQFFLQHSIIMDNPDSTKLQDNPIVTLSVGPDKRTFQVHQELLFKRSPVFQAAFSGECRESSERCMALPEDDPETVERFMQWLYFKSLSLTKGVSHENLG